MRNRGFYWGLTILLVAVCVYQLSFTFLTFNVEGKADKQADKQVKALMEQAKGNNNIATLPNGETIDFSTPEAYELAKAAYINDILSKKAKQKVFLGSDFQEVKSKSLSFGLDLVGGMSVTLEVSVADMIKSYALNPNDESFKKPYEQAVKEHNEKGTDFLEVFFAKFKKVNGADARLARFLNLEDLEGLDRNSSNEDVINTINKVIKNSMGGIQQIMAKRINQFGVAQPNIQTDESRNRIYIELPGVQDEATVVNRLKSTANLQFYEVYHFEEMQAYLPEANRLSLINEVEYNSSDSTDVDSSAVNVIAPASEKGFMEYVTNGNFASVGFVEEKDKNAVDAILARQDVKNVFPQDLVFMWSDKATPMTRNGNKLFYQLFAVHVPLSGKARVGGTDVKNAYFQRDQETNQITVNVSMTEEGSEKWAEMTRENLHKSVAITMDNVVYSAPQVQSVISGGNTQITGNFSIDEAKDLAGLLNGGSLPAPTVIKNQSKVGPTIGAENSKAGLASFGVAFIFIFLYMMFYYSKGGMYANIALVANMILLVGTLASFGAVLTLAGIAGIVLTLGTAIDANILIFERIREEEAKGLSYYSAIQIGFKKAMPAIIDANMTNLVSAIVLKILGTGEINSFATTLLIGIFTSVFSAVVITKLLVFAQADQKKEVTFHTRFSKNLFRNFHFDWVSKRKYFYIFSITVTIIGTISLWTRGLSSSVEFTGGRTYSVKMEKAADIEALRANLESVLVDDKGHTASVELKTLSNDYNVEILTNYKLADDNATEEVEQKVREGLDKGVTTMGDYKILESRTISNSMSLEVLQTSQLALFFALLLIFIYILISFRNWRYSLASIISLAHDSFFTISIFSLFHGILPFNMDMNPAFIAAILTIIGYSINDTVIVFDRIRENLGDTPVDTQHTDLVNMSLNTTLSRTMNTSLSLIGVLLIMFLFGGTAIKGFLFALLIGIVIGTYSSLCVSTPILIDLSGRKKIRRKIN